MFDQVIKQSILIVEDDGPVRQMIGFWLRRRGFSVCEAPDAKSALDVIGQRLPDLILVDWRLPAMNGLELSRQLRATMETRDIPLIMVSGNADSCDRIAALDGGVDDYVTKPFAPRELIARIHAVLRRRRRTATASDVAAPVAAHPSVDLAEVLGGLGPIDGRLLQYFVRYPERVHTRAQLRDFLWGSSDMEERSVDVQIRRLRQALESFQLDGLIQTVRGAGYRFSTRPA